MSNVSNNNNRSGRKRGNGGNQPRGQPPQKKARKTQRPNRGRRPDLINVQQRAIPNAVPASVMPKAPQMYQRDGKTILAGHENFATVNGSTAFAATRYQVNPGLASLFAWLSGRASGYEKYRVHKLEVMYVPAEAVVTTAGVVYLAFDYDPDDAAPSSLASLSTYEGLQNSHTYEVCRNFLDVRAVQRDILKIRTGPKAGSRLLFDPCSIVFATVSMASAAAIGQLWIGYEIEVLAPQIEPSTPVPSSISAFVMTGGAQALVTTVAEPVEWDTLVNGLELTNTAGVMTMPLGTYKVSGYVTFRNSAAETSTYNVEVWRNGAVLASGGLSRMTLTSIASGQTAVPFSAYVSATAATDTIQIQVTATGAAGTLTLQTDSCALFIEAL